jgi:hypothetical protein
LLFKIPIDKPKEFFEIYSQPRQAPSKMVRQPWSRALNSWSSKGLYRPIIGLLLVLNHTKALFETKHGLLIFNKHSALTDTGLEPVGVPDVYTSRRSLGCGYVFIALFEIKPGILPQF